ncbi:dimethylargininase [Dactylosporangium sp. NPDC048998]|uniref:dimethylargininase n=1 Tax=Dactylosporangium sp. NPDC048998 TaxID=3363976 RepID=UPI0037139191
MPWRPRTAPASFGASREPASAPEDSVRRKPTRRRYVMVRPTYFDVDQSTNPLTDTRDETCRARVIDQWERLRELHLGLGHQVAEIEPQPGLPDMVFVTSAATVWGGKVLVARFRHRQRAAESSIYLDWFQSGAYQEIRQAVWINEGERDHQFAGPRLLAASSQWAGGRPHAEMREFFGVPVVELTLVDPRFHRLENALAVLDQDMIMYYPAAFSPPSQEMLGKLFPGAIVASEADATAFGLCAVSDGRHVVLPEAAHGLFAELMARGFEPIGADVSELVRSGGGIRSCTLELH